MRIIFLILLLIGIIKKKRAAQRAETKDGAVKSQKPQSKKRKTKASGK